MEDSFRLVGFVQEVVAGREERNGRLKETIYVPKYAQNRVKILGEQKTKKKKKKKQNKTNEHRRMI